MKKLDLSAFLFLFLSLPAFAQQEFLDATFGNAGKQLVSLPGYDKITDLNILADGKILVAGISFHFGQHRFSLARYHPDGALDTDFGLAGKTHTLPAPSGDQYSFGYIGVQTDGKILLLDRDCSAGYQYLLRYQPNGFPDNTWPFPIQLYFQDCYRSVAIAGNKIVLAGRHTDGLLVGRLNSNGTKDQTFGTNSIVKVDFGNSALASDILNQPDGKIVVGGLIYGDTAHFGLARINATGILDSSFGTGGKLILDQAKSISSPVLALQTDGKLLVAGHYANTYAVIRLNPDGTMDDSFGLGGVAALSGVSTFLDIKYVPGGAILVACRINATDAIIKLSDSGVPDANFAGTGFLYTASNYNVLAIQADNRIVVAGTKDGDFCLLRYLSDGAPDSSFNNGAGTTTDIGESGGRFAALALQPDGKLVAVGTQFNGQYGGGATIARFEAGGALDTGFNTGGMFVSGLGYQGGNAVVLQPDGKIIAGAGHYDMFGTAGGSLYRVFPDGAIDSSFFNNWTRLVSSLALQPDGKLLALGVEHSDSGPFYANLVRYLPDGSIDTSFGTSGFVTSSTYWFDRLALQPDGKILVAGLADDFSSGSLAALLRYRPDGLVDESFGTNGIVTESLEDYSPPVSIILRPDGKITLVRQYLTPGGELLLVLTRYLENGAPDAGFGIDGKTLLPVGAYIGAAQLQPDGKILVAGEGYGVSSDFFLARILPDGSRDTTIGKDGFVVTDFNGGEDIPYALAVQPDGKVILAGTSDEKFALARYRADLSLESKEVYGQRIYPLKITPDPVTDFLHLQLPETAANAPAEVQVFDAQGRLVLSRALTPGQALHVRELATGRYMLNVTAEGQVYAAHFVKQ